MTEEPRYYFAYGANMNTRVLVRRGLAWVGGEPGVLRDYECLFAVPGLPWIEPGFLTVRQAPGDLVHGVLYEMSADDLQALDGYESEQVRFVVSIETGSGTYEATTYRSKRFVPGLKPSRRYKRLVVQGARDHGLPEDWIARFEEQPHHYVPGVSEGFAFMMGSIERFAAATDLWARINRVVLGKRKEE